MISTMYYSNSYKIDLLEKIFLAFVSRQIARLYHLSCICGENYVLKFNFVKNHFRDGMIVRCTVSYLSDTRKLTSAK